MIMTNNLPPLVEAYLDDLDRALASVDPRERAETVVAVRDHAAELIARHGSDDEASRRVLTELGPVDTIAASATPAASAPAPATAPAAPVTIDVVDVVLPIVTVLLAFIAPVTMVWAIVRLVRGVGSKALQWLTIVLGALPTGTALFLLVMHYANSLQFQ